MPTRLVGVFTQNKSVKGRLFTLIVSPNGLTIFEISKHSYWININNLTEKFLAPTAEFMMNPACMNMAVLQVSKIHRFHTGLAKFECVYPNNVASVTLAD